MDKILGVLYGMAIGDAMGMPPELWPRSKVKQEYGEITDFCDGHPDNEISYQYVAGNFTDDTAQALTILDSLIETNFVPISQNIAKHLLDWAVKEDAFANNILGPTSKAALELYAQNKSSEHIAAQALTNGAAMRIAPIGTLFLPHQKQELCEYVYQISKITHASDVALTAAAMVAMAVAAALEYGDRDKMLAAVYDVENYILPYGAPTISAKMSTRLRYCIDLAHRYVDDSEKFSEELYNLMGAGVHAVDSVPCAIAIAYYCFDVQKSALLCANLGGDTDTIGAMATAICGAATGFAKIPAAYIAKINAANQVDWQYYAATLLSKRGNL